MKRSKRYAQYKRDVRKHTARVAPVRFGTTRDHIVPVSFGFKHDIPADLIGSKRNLEYMSLNDNIQKGQRMTPLGIDVLRFWALLYNEPRYRDLADVYEAKIK